MDVSIFLRMLIFQRESTTQWVIHTCYFALKVAELIELYSTLVLFWTRNRLYLAAVGCSDCSCSIITLGTRANLCAIVWYNSHNLFLQTQNASASLEIPLLYYNLASVLGMDLCENHTLTIYFKSKVVLKYMKLSTGSRWVGNRKTRGHECWEEKTYERRSLSLSHPLQIKCPTSN